MKPQNLPQWRVVYAQPLERGKTWMIDPSASGQKRACIPMTPGVQ
ncbi:hypothetical protein ACI2KS_25085 [Pseudomonas sp. NPDC087358]